MGMRPPLVDTGDVTVSVALGEKGGDFNVFYLLKLKFLLEAEYIDHFDSEGSSINSSGLYCFNK
jgi:hypothetical protein